jgi:hypothetical protein
VLSLTLNQAVFHPGDTMVLTVTLTPGIAPPPVDAYIVILVALRFVRPTQMVFRLDQPRR